MGVTGGGLIQCKQLLELPEREVSLYILLFIHHTAAECLLVGLALKYFLLYGPCLQKRSEMKHSWDTSAEHYAGKASLIKQQSGPQSVLSDQYR